MTLTDSEQIIWLAARKELTIVDSSEADLQTMDLADDDTAQYNTYCIPLLGRRGLQTTRR